MKLTDDIIASATIEPGKTSRALQDGGRLFLRVTADGAKQWRLKWQAFPGPKGERMTVLGVYPAVSIEAARAAAARVRTVAAAKAAPLAPVPASIPAAVRQAVSAPPLSNGNGVPTFGFVAEHWATFDQQITERALYRKRLHIEKFAPLHDIPINEVNVEQCIAVHDAIRAAGGDHLHTAMRAGLYMSCIFKHALRWGIVHNPAEDRKAWVGRTDKKALAARRQAHITDPHIFGLLMERVDLWESPHGPTSSAFIRFIARAPVRASELAGAKWAEFHDLTDPDKALWIIPAERMKQRQRHDVPLSPQVVAILTAQRAYVDSHYPGGSEYVFPNRDSGRRHIDGDNQRRTLAFLGYGPRDANPQSVHGLRHTFLTMAAEAGQSVEIADRCLAHSDANKVRARYNMSVQLAQRRALLLWWSDEIERLKAGYTPSRAAGAAA